MPRDLKTVFIPECFRSDNQATAGHTLDVSEHTQFERSRTVPLPLDSAPWMESQMSQTTTQTLGRQALDSHRTRRTAGMTHEPPSDLCGNVKKSYPMWTGH